MIITITTIITMIIRIINVVPLAACYSGDIDNLDVLGSSFNDSPLGTSLERDRLINEDPSWNG